MYKSNIVFIVSFIILSSSSLLFYIIYFEDDTHKYFQSSFQKNKSNAPIIVSLFENVDNDGHDQFISSENCLVCHTLGVETKANSKAPTIHYKCRKSIVTNCKDCHGKNNG